LTKQVKTLEELLKELPPERHKEVRAFVESMLGEQSVRPRAKPKLAWAGALNDLRGRFTGVDLQHQIARWRSNGA
jgi:hypothetical protein